MNTLGALVLCGGQSRRMGRPKAWLAFGDEFLLQRVVRKLGEVVGRIVVVAAPGQDVPPLPPGVALTFDSEPFQGPLQGIAEGLKALPDTVELAFATSTDAPFLRPEWVVRLSELIGLDDVAIPEVDGYFQPLSALYRRATTLPAANQLLAEGRRRPVDLIETLRARIVLPEELRIVDPLMRTLRNLNTPEDYEAALRDLSRE